MKVGLRLVDKNVLTAWAMEEAARLRTKAGEPEVGRRMAYLVETRPMAAAALEFLSLHAGGAFARTAEGIFESDKGRAEAALLRVADILEGWVEYIKSDVAAELPFTLSARVAASNDLMEQVEELLGDESVHVAAPVVLAGAALEEVLRGMCEAVKGDYGRGLVAYVQHLKSSGLCSAQDVKDVTAWAGQRTEAAHGRFEDLSRARARIMTDGINLFIQTKTAGDLIRGAS